MSNFVQVLAVQPYRVQVLTDSTWTGINTPGNYTFARQDGIATSIVVATVIPLDSISVGLALSAPLAPGVIYLLTATGVSGVGIFSYQVPQARPATVGALDDPEAEAFGLDLDWLADTLDGGDMPIIKGVRCLQEDLVNIAATNPGELFHRPTEGGGLPEDVNGTTNVGALASRVRTQWLKDSRVKAANPQVTVGTDGQTTVKGTVTPYAIDTQLPVQVS